MNLQSEKEFEARHIGPADEDLDAMLKTIGSNSLESLIDDTIPPNIRLKKTLSLPDAVTESELLKILRSIAGKNKLYRSYLGQGYYGTITPPVILRNVFENPGWYTQYTPYQAEISQGRLEAMLNFQTMVSDLTGMEVANASLLDEGTAAAEAMSMIYGIVNRNVGSSSRNKFFVSEKCFVQTIEVLRARALPLGFEIVVGDHRTINFDSTYFGAILQYPAEQGEVLDYSSFIQKLHEAGGLSVVATDLLSLCLLKPPGEFGADVVVGNSQRFGTPMGYGGPHAAFFATKTEYIRFMPGRIIGVSIDSQNNPAYRMTLQTREQHIRREKATSNICTAQALLAIMAAFYGIYHGPAGLKKIAQRINGYARLLASKLNTIGFNQVNEIYFDTLKIEVTDKEIYKKIQSVANTFHCNFRFIDDKHIGISLDETISIHDLKTIVNIFGVAGQDDFQSFNIEAFRGMEESSFSKPFERKSSYLNHPVFHKYHSETQMLRYIKSLENKDLSLTYSMIPLGSCTMKLNATSELIPVSWPEFSQLHPFVPVEQAEGYRQIIADLESYLCEITGLAAASLQPNSGAQGEYAGLLVIKAYQADTKEGKRNVALIPSSAHGTNPASAVMAGLKVVIVNCDEKGNIDLADLRKKAEQHKESLSVLMVTYPSTHGVFEEHIQEVCEIIHQHGGQVYMDGANMNAQVGLTTPALIGADVCHLNLHKTFAIPHGGGGPGMGPICVAKHLAPFLPGHPIVKIGGEKSIPAIASTPYGSASIILISYAYIRMLGPEGLMNATKFAILNANYLKYRLHSHYPVLYEGKKGYVAHEFILNTRQFKQEANIEVEDIAKRLMDYGFHAPTVSFPVPGTLMIEPTESEPKEELDRFADALIAIRREIQDIIEKKADRTDNVLKNAPHTSMEATKEVWDHPYTREQAVFPLAFLKTNKFWPPVGRVNNTYGDRNIFCSCPPVESFIDDQS